MEVVIEELSNYSDKKQRFISEFFADIVILSTAEVDVACKLAENHKKILVESIVRCLEKDNSSISTNCNHILESVDLVSCLKTESGLLDKLQQSIDSVKNITKRDMTTTMKILKKACAIVPKCQQVMSYRPSNLFHSYQEISGRETVDKLASYIAYESVGSSFLTFLDCLYSWTFVECTPKDSDYECFIAKIADMRREFGWDLLPYEYSKNLCSGPAFTPWWDGFRSSNAFIDSLTTKKGYLTLYSQNFTTNTLFSSLGDSSYILKAKSNINCTVTGNCGMMIKIYSSLCTGDKPFRFDIKLCSASNKADAETEVHFHDELVSPDVHVCLNLVRSQMFLPLSWYGKPEYDTGKDIWRWGANYFCASNEDKGLFSDHNTEYKRRWNLGQDTEVQLVAFVRIV